jgi:hypothetical protein
MKLTPILGAVLSGLVAGSSAWAALPELEGHLSFSAGASSNLDNAPTLPYGQPLATGTVESALDAKLSWGNPEGIHYVFSGWGALNEYTASEGAGQGSAQLSPQLRFRTHSGQVRWRTGYEFSRSVDLTQANDIGQIGSYVSHGARIRPTIELTREWSLTLNSRYRSLNYTDSSRKDQSTLGKASALWETSPQIEWEWEAGYELVNSNITSIAYQGPLFGANLYWLPSDERTWNLSLNQARRSYASVAINETTTTLSASFEQQLSKSFLWNLEASWTRNASSDTYSQYVARALSTGFELAW